MPASDSQARTGTAALAARGGRTSSKNGTESPSRAWNGPIGQFPRPINNATPSTDKNAAAE